MVLSMRLPKHRTILSMTGSPILTQMEMDTMMMIKRSMTG
ncbi:MAG TPA: hypothetical protein D7I15_04960 [Candidatus Poseidoniales archaeon]|nr:MAG TPA: hypothetical protein D7I15_04960 [Candidatus Poseidoniales archaeon]